MAADFENLNYAGCPKKPLAFEFQISYILLNSSEKLYEFNRICLI